MTITSLPAHVYARIAEDVQKQTGIETDSLEINALLHDEYDHDEILKSTRLLRLYRCAWQEARGYGLTNS